MIIADVIRFAVIEMIGKAAEMIIIDEILHVFLKFTITDS